MSQIRTQERPDRNGPRWRLIEEIVARSVADNWSDAKTEWKVDHIFFADPDSPGACLCGKRPIIEICVIHNRDNGGTAAVGNCCVKRFVGIDASAMFRAVRRIMADPARALNAEAVEYAHRRGWIDDRDLSFYLDTLRTPARPTLCSRGLSPKQLAWRKDVNLRVLDCMAAGRGADHD